MSPPVRDAGGLVAAVWLAALTGGLLACTGSGPATVEEAGATAGAIDLQGDAAKPKAPSDAAGFIALLWPLPSPQLHVTYDLKGPGGLEGTLDLRLRQDASRREDWVLRVPVPDAEPIEVKGTTIQNSSVAWTARAGEAGTRSPSPLHGVVAAYLEESPGRREKAAATLREWTTLVQRAREETPGETQTIAGITCLELALAGRKVCLWEEAGLPLRYEGPSFSLVATKVDRDTALDDTLFKLPVEARAARDVPLPAALQIDGKAAMNALVEGDLGPIAVLLTPGFRVPESWGVGDTPSE